MSERMKKIVSICLVLFLSVAFFATVAMTSSLATRYTKLQQDRDELERTYVALQYECAKKKEEYAQIKKKYDELKEQQEEILANLDKLQQADILAEQVISLQGTISSLNDTIASLKNNISSLQEQITALNTSNAIAQNNYNELQAEYNNLAKQYDALYSVFSSVKGNVSKDSLYKNVFPGLLCVGDSLTAGNLGSGGWSYPSQIALNMKTDLTYNPEVINEGRASWTSEQLYYLEPSQIAKSGWGNRIFVVWMGINGGWQLYDSQVVPVYNEDGSIMYGSDGQPVMETKLVFNEDASIENLIRQTQHILNSQTDPQKRFIVVGISRPLGREQSDILFSEKMEKRMAEYFGDKYINIREYLTTSAIAESGITLSETDRTWLEIGRPPASFMNLKTETTYDVTHFNDLGYTLVGNYVYRRMDKLGYFDTIKSINSWY